MELEWYEIWEPGSFNDTWGEVLYREDITDKETAVEKLIEMGADVNARTSRDGFTPLMITSQRGLIGCVKKLIEAGANVDAKAYLFHETAYKIAANNQIRSLLRNAEKIRADYLKAHPNYSDVYRHALFLKKHPEGRRRGYRDVYLRGGDLDAYLKTVKEIEEAKERFLKKLEEREKQRNTVAIVKKETKSKKGLTALLSEQALEGTEKLEGKEKRKAELEILRKTNVQVLRDAEGKARAKKTAEILKKKQKTK